MCIIITMSESGSSASAESPRLPEEGGASWDHNTLGEPSTSVQDCTVSATDQKLQQVLYITTATATKNNSVGNNNSTATTKN